MRHRSPVLSFSGLDGLPRKRFSRDWGAPSRDGFGPSATTCKQLHIKDKHGCPPRLGLFTPAFGSPGKILAVGRRGLVVFALAGPAKVKTLRCPPVEPR